jgi:hypothetical protein
MRLTVQHKAGGRPRARKQLLCEAALLLLLLWCCCCCEGCCQAGDAVSEGPAAGHGLQCSIEVAGVAQVGQARHSEWGGFQSHGGGCVEMGIC